MFILFLELVPTETDGKQFLIMRFGTEAELFVRPDD